MTAFFPLLFVLAAEGPQLDLPATDAPLTLPAPQLGTASPDERVLLRGLQELRLATDGTVIGGYGQINGNALAVGPGPQGEAVGTPALSASLRRLVLFVSHTFDAGLRVYAEFEWENAVACRNCVGSAEVEQAFLEWPLLRQGSAELLTLRGGLVIVPIGIINQWHEPPVFHGVERPRLEEGGIIPSTWRELGFGITGRPHPGLRYELYATTGLDPTKLDANGLSGARSGGALAPAHSLMISSRLELEPFLGMICGLSGIAGDMGGAWLGVTPFFDVNAQPLPLTLPLYGVNADARVRRFGLEARTVVAAFALPASGDLMQARRSDTTLLFPVPVGGTGALPTAMLGASLEVAYDVLTPLQRFGVVTEQQLLPFVRVEYSDAQAAVPEGYARDPAFSIKELTAGVSYRPIRQVVAKADVQLRNRRAGDDEVQGNLGLGFMF